MPGRSAKSAGLKPATAKAVTGGSISVNFTTVKRSEIKPALFNATLKQLRIKKEDF